MKRGLPISAVHHVTRLAREMKKFETLDLHVAQGRADLKLRSKRKRQTFVRDLAALLAAWFLEKQGRNYVEVELSAPPLWEVPPGWDRCFGPLILTVRRRDGQTPHQLQVAAERERDALRTEVKFYTTALHNCQDNRAAYLKRAETAEAERDAILAQAKGSDVSALTTSPNPLEEAQLLIDTFASRNGQDESNLCDILADLMLWSEHQGLKFGDQLTRAQATWLAESPAADEIVLQVWGAAGNPFPNDHEETKKGDTIIPADVRHVLDCLAWNPADKKSDLIAYIRDGQDALNALLAKLSDPVPVSDPDELNRAQIIAAARAQYEHEGSVEIDDHAAFSRGDDDGLYVAAWVWVSQEPDRSDDIAYEDMSAEQLAAIKGAYSVDDGPAGEFDNLLDAINACAAAAKANKTFSHVYEHHHGGRRYEVWEVDGRFCSCDHETVTHKEGQWRDCGEICDECGQPLPPECQP